jgi:hypothetical protein
MLKNDFEKIQQVKCIICSATKGKDVMLGPKFDTLEKHRLKRQKQVVTCHIWVRRKRILIQQKM